MKLIIGATVERNTVKGLTFEQIAQAMNKDEVWVAALFYGQVSGSRRLLSSSVGAPVLYIVNNPVPRKAKASEDELRALADVLKIRQSGQLMERLMEQLGPRWYPNRGIGPVPPTDPVIYRLFEASQPPLMTHIPFSPLMLCSVHSRAC
jgi:cyanate lyase